SDLKGARLAIAATDDPALQKKIAEDAKKRGVWINVVDVPVLCDFIAPAVVNRGSIQIAISTGGAAPALAKHLRKKLESLVGQEYADFTKIVGAMRPKILKLPKKVRRAFWNRVVQETFFEGIRQKGIRKAEERLNKWLESNLHV